MKLERCPTCHANINLDTLVQDNSAKSLLGAVAKLPTKLGANIISYVALFRPAKSDLNNERATRLIYEVLELTTNKNALAQALEQTVLTLHQNRQQGTAQPLKNHRYLTKVLDSVKEKNFHPTNTNTDKSPANPHAKVFYQESEEQNKIMFEENLAKWKGE